MAFGKKIVNFEKKNSGFESFLINNFILNKIFLILKKK
jgi:hypothetical protein